LSDDLDILEEKLAFLLKELASQSAATQKFETIQAIKDVKAQIARLEQKSAPPRRSARVRAARRRSRGVSASELHIVSPVGPRVGETEYDRILSLNPLVNIQGRPVAFGLADEELEYIMRWLAEYGHIDNPSQWRSKLPAWLLRLAGESDQKVADGLRNAAPRKAKIAVRPFQLSRYPVTNRQFEIFISNCRGYKTQAEKKKSKETWRSAYEASGPNHPVVNVSFRDAQAFCEWCNVRLPTRDEYERAVRGLGDTLFPWGAEWFPDCCNDLYYVDTESTTPVDEFPESQSSDGIYDLCGNVAEWATAPGLRRGIALLVGGGYNAAAVVLSNATSSRQAMMDYFAPNAGFRFATDAP
jgi:formylglycine-generating enzyme required for sulfatase activity